MQHGPVAWGQHPVFQRYYPASGLTVARCSSEIGRPRRVTNFQSALNSLAVGRADCARRPRGRAVTTRRGVPANLHARRARRAASALPETRAAERPVRAAAPGYTAWWPPTSSGTRPTRVDRSDAGEGVGHEPAGGVVFGRLRRCRSDGAGCAHATHGRLRRAECRGRGRREPSPTLTISTGSGFGQTNSPVGFAYTGGAAEDEDG